MVRRPPRSTLTDTLFPYTTLFRSRHQVALQAEARHFGEEFGTIAARNARLETGLFEISGAVNDPARQARHGDRRGAAFANAALRNGADGEHAEHVERLGEGGSGQRERGDAASNEAAMHLSPPFGPASPGPNRNPPR